MKIEIELKQTESELPIISNMYGKFFYTCYVCNATTRDTGFVFVDKYDRKFNICAKCCADNLIKGECNDESKKVQR